VLTYRDLNVTRVDRLGSEDVIMERESYISHSNNLCSIPYLLRKGSVFSLAGST
jgi:hypothetical protein